MHLTEIVILLEHQGLADASQGCKELLDRFGLRYESRHGLSLREPRELTDFINRSEQAGIKLFVVFSSSASSLAAVVSAYATVPVIGVPVQGSPFGGQDAIYSMLQVPEGLPVATMGMGPDGSRNAAVFAAQVLALSDERLRDRLRFYKQNGCSFV